VFPILFRVLRPLLSFLAIPFFPTMSLLLSPSSAFYPLLWVSPANPLHCYSLSQAIVDLEQRVGKTAGEILDILPAALALLRMACPIQDGEASHIESCLLAPFRSEHRLKMWYVQNQIRHMSPIEETHEVDEEDAEDVEYAW